MATKNKQNEWTLARKNEMLKRIKHALPGGTTKQGLATELVGELT